MVSKSRRYINFKDPIVDKEATSEKEVRGQSGLWFLRCVGSDGDESRPADIPLLADRS